MKALLRTLGLNLVLAAVYLGLARFGLMLDAVSGFATLVWPPTGLALTAVLLGGRRMWPGIAVGAFLVNVWVGAPLLAALGISVGNTLEAVIGATLLQRVEFRNSLERVRDALALIIMAATISTSVSALLGVLSLFASGVIPWAKTATTLQAWWLGDLLGDLVIAPLLLVWASGGRVRLQLRSGVELALFTVVFLAFGGLVFGGEASPFRQAAFLSPLFVWAAMRFGLQGAVTATFVASVIAVWGTVHGHGPFIKARLSDSLIALQAFVASTAVTTLLLGAAILERRRAVEARDVLLATVSHDLKNPINAILLSTETQLRNLPESDVRTRKSTMTIRRATQRMEALIRDLLDRSALDAGRMALRRASHDASGILRESVDLLKTNAEAKHQTLVSEASNERLSVSCDRERVLQVFSNLIGNAITYSPPRGTITCGAARVGDFVKFTVRDDGPGIPRHDVSHLFDPYWQGKATGRAGTGLGLSIAKGIVDAHGGSIWTVSSATGSTFCFTMPIGLEDAAVDRPLTVGTRAPAPTTERESVEAQSLIRLRESTQTSDGAASAVEVAPRAAIDVLIVDDDEDMRDVVRITLAGAGLVTAVAQNGAEALEAIQRSRPSLVLLDSVMPVMDGAECCRRIRSDLSLRDLPVILLSADDDVRKKAATYGATDTLQKPVDARTLIALVRHYVPTNRAARAVHVR